MLLPSLFVPAGSIVSTALGPVANRRHRDAQDNDHYDDLVEFYRKVHSLKIRKILKFV